MQINNTPVTVLRHVIDRHTATNSPAVFGKTKPPVKIDDDIHNTYIRMPRNYESTYPLTVITLFIFSQQRMLFFIKGGTRIQNTAATAARVE